MDGQMLPYYRGVPRQRGRGIGALAAVVGRSAIPIFKNMILPTAKRFLPTAKRLGKELMEAALPEVLDVFEGKKTVKQAARKTAGSVVRKQVGGGRICKKKVKRNSRKDFFKHIKE